MWSQWNKCDTKNRAISSDFICNACIPIAKPLFSWFDLSVECYNKPTYIVMMFGELAKETHILCFESLYSPRWQPESFNNGNCCTKPFGRYWQYKLNLIKLEMINNTQCLLFCYGKWWVNSEQRTLVWIFFDNYLKCR